MTSCLFVIIRIILGRLLYGFDHDLLGFFPEGIRPLKLVNCFLRFLAAQEEEGSANPTETAKGALLRRAARVYPKGPGAFVGQSLDGLKSH